MQPYGLQRDGPPSFGEVQTKPASPLHSLPVHTVLSGKSVSQWPAVLQNKPTPHSLAKPALLHPASTAP